MTSYFEHVAGTVSWPLVEAPPPAPAEDGGITVIEEPLTEEQFANLLRLYEAACEAMP